MKDLIESFSLQLSEAIEIGEKAKFTQPAAELRNVIITGLGGSGIGGSIAAQVIQNEIKIPVIVNKDYFIPEFTDEHTLVIVSSYSGNTEETLDAFKGAVAKKAKICCITSGGKILEEAKEKNLDHIIIPGGRPPRSAMAYSFTQLFYALHGYNLISDSFKDQLKKSVLLLDQEAEHIRAEAFYIAEKLHKKIPVIYAAANYEGVAIRLRQQINENSKMLCWHNVLPEMNHNELVGWTMPNDKIAVVFFRNEDDYERTQFRMNLTKEIISKYTPHIFEIFSKGDSQLEKSFYLINTGDWISWYLSELRNIDATEVKVIDHLKNELAKI